MSRFTTKRTTTTTRNITAGPQNRFVIVCLLVIVLGAGSGVRAQFSAPMDVPPPGKAATDRIPILEDVGLDQKPDAQLPLDTPFVDEQGREVRLGEFFGSRPVVLVLAYYNCPMLCTLVLNGAVAALQTLSFDAGTDFEFVVVSFDPGDTPARALEKKAEYVPRYGRERGEAGMHFLTGRASSIAALTDAVGFKYAYDPALGQFAHPSLITVVTPAGRISRYLLGIDFPAYDLRLALVEAADGKVGSAVDKALLYCYHYDPETGTYGLAIMNVVRLGGLLTLAAIGTFVLMSRRRERRHEPADQTTANVLGADGAPARTRRGAVGPTQATGPGSGAEPRDRER